MPTFQLADTARDTRFDGCCPFNHALGAIVADYAKNYRVNKMIWRECPGCQREGRDSIWPTSTGVDDCPEGGKHNFEYLRCTKCRYSI